MCLALRRTGRSRPRETRAAVAALSRSRLFDATSSQVKNPPSLGLTSDGHEILAEHDLMTNLNSSTIHMVSTGMLDTADLSVEAVALNTHPLRGSTTTGTAQDGRVFLHVKELYQYINTSTRKCIK